MMRVTTGAVLALMAAAGAEERVIQSFEGDGFGTWEVSGSGFGLAPVPGHVLGLNGDLRNYSDEGVACSARGGDAATGRLVSPEFEVKDDYLLFRVAGGRHPGGTAVQLVAGDELLLEATGNNDLDCRRVVWDLRPFAGRKVRIRVIDEETGSWGVIAADHFVLGDNPNYKFPPPTRKGVVAGEELVASETIPGMTVPKGVVARVVASHEGQGVTSPTALAFGENGELYVAETHRFRFGVEDNRSRLYWVLDDLAARTVEDRAKLLEKWSEKAPPDWMTAKTEVVRRLSDPGEDGVYRKSGVFADDYRAAVDGTMAGVFELDGTVYVACIPKIEALRDEDGDGVPEKRQVIQDGFGPRFSISGHDLNGFALGPDGRLYGTVGDRGFNLVTKEGVAYESLGQGAVFRFDLDGSNFEVIHTGLRNPKEIAFDEHGNAFSVDNNSDQGDEARIVYIVDGGDSGWRMGHQAMHTFHREIGLEERPPNQWMDERMWEKQNSAQPASIVPPVAYLTSGPSGLTYHPGTGFLESEAGRFLICDYTGGSAGSGIWSFKVERKGAGMKLADAHRLNWGAAVTDVEYSWDGRLVVTDFIGGWESHDAGRVYELKAEKPFRAEAAAEVPGLIRKGFAGLSSKELAQLLKHPDMRVRTRAELELTRRDDGAEFLGGVALKGEGLARFHGIWGLGVIARRGKAAQAWGVGGDFTAVPGGKRREEAYKLLIGLAGDGDVEIRSQAVKMIGEAGLAGDRVDFGGLLQDSSARVRMFAAITVGRTKSYGALPYLWEMLEVNADEDPYLRHAGAYALELMCKPQQLLALRTHRSPSVRLAAAIALGRQGDSGVAVYLADKDPRVADEAVRLIHDRGIEEARPKVAALLDRREGVERPKMVWWRLLHSAFRLGDAENAARVLSVALDRGMSAEVRKEALRLLGEWTKPHPVDQSLGRWAPLPERDPELIRGVLQPSVEALFEVEPDLMASTLHAARMTGLDLSGLSDARLRGLVTDFKLPGDARAEALDLYVGRKPEGLDDLLARLAGAPDERLAPSAIGLLVERQSPKAAGVLKEAVASKSEVRQQAAWRQVGKLDGPAAAALVLEGLGELSASDGRMPAALELLETAKSRGEPEVTEALAAFEAKLANSEDPLAKWNPAMLGGDSERGRRLFESHPVGQCMRCHGTGGHGGGQLAGPDLSEVGKRGDRRFLLESIVNPAAKVAAGFGTVIVTLKDGSTVGGALSAENEQDVVIDVAGERKTIARSDIQVMSEPVSAMPPMAALLKPEEIRDLVAWLSTRR